MSDPQEVKADSSDSEEAGFNDAPSSPVVDTADELAHEPKSSLTESAGQEGDGKDASAVENMSASPKPQQAAGLGLEAAAPIIEKSNGAPSPAQLPTKLYIDPNSHPAESLHPPESPTTSLISSLRDQLNLISDQAHQLNQKLVSSISRSADLEDELHDLRSKHESLGEKAKALKEERDRWEESMNTGLLVERSQISTEMQRLAAGLVEEERRRGSAEEKRMQVENEVDDLTAKLFDQANTMVVTERMSRVQAESRLKHTEENLAAAEAAVRDMQLHLQSLTPSAIVATAPLSASSAAAGPAAVASTSAAHRRYLSSHVPYAEYISFLAHLRALRPIKETSKIPQPLVANLLAQPFLARCVTEDNDSTLRLDAAPDLNWLSRRSVAQAVISGDLIVEPVSASSVLAGTTTPMLDIGCSLCGKPVFPQTVPPSPAGSHFGPPPMHPHRTSSSQTSQSRFSLKPFFNATATASTSTALALASPLAAPLSPSQSPLSSPAVNGAPSTVYVFRIARSTQSTSTEKGDTKAYPLCRTGWCLERMRATCELWHFVRTGIVHVVWHSDDGPKSRPVSAESSTPTPASAPVPTSAAVDPASQLSAAQISGLEPRDISVDSDIPPRPPARKKSSWALGFKLSEKSSGGWSRWKTGGSEPVSPNAEKRGSFGSLGAEKENGETPAPEGEGEVKGEAEAEAVLGAPLEINEKDVPVPAIHEPVGEEIAALPAPAPAPAPTATQEDGSPGGEEEKKLNAPPLQRGASSGSLALSTSSQTDEAASFSTPKGMHTELLSDEEGAEPTSASAPDAPSAPADDGATGATEDGGESIDRERTPVAPHKSNGAAAPEVNLNSPAPSPRAPPPIPKRAAARNRSSQISDGEGSRTGSAVDLTSLVDGQGLRDPPQTEKTEANDDDDSASAPGTGKETSTSTGTSTSIVPNNEMMETGKPAPPPLPPRPPRTPNLSAQNGTPGQAQRQEGGKTFLDTNADNEGWEEKTWKQVVRLKEEMWKARIGVSHTQE